MSLPVNSTPIYTLTIPSSEKLVKFRPFLIKEEKALLIAQQSEDPVVMVNSLKEVIASCLSNKDNIDFDVNDLATFDLEYVFTQIRAKSVGENIELQLKCDTCTDEKAIATVYIDLTSVKVEKNPEHTNKISLYNDVGIVLKYPSIDLIRKLELTNMSDIDQTFDIVTECIDYIYTQEEVFHAKEQSKTELLDFLNNLTTDQFSKIQKFFETMPKLKKEIEYKCPICGKLHNKTLEGLTSFF